MKKNCFVLCFLLAAVLSAPTAKAQVADTMSVPFGCFEQWNTLPGDTMSLMGLPIPINSGYTLPEGWEIPHYDINDTVSYMGLTLPINTSIPLGKVYRDSVNAPEGSSALVAESFIFQDVLDPMAFSLAQSFLDTGLVNTVLPSVVSTGQADINKIIPLIENILGNPDDLSWLLDIVDTADLNNYIKGGFPLNGFQPGRLLGYYKYIYDHSYGFRDYGAVIALGTRYDTIEHRRMIVGAGSKSLYQLYDWICKNFSPCADTLYPVGAQGWAVKEATRILDKGEASSYGYAALFYELAYMIGYQPVLISGSIYGTQTYFEAEDGTRIEAHAGYKPYAWVEIKFDGISFIFDTAGESQFDSYRMYYKRNEPIRWQRGYRSDVF